MKKGVIAGLVILIIGITLSVGLYLVVNHYSYKPLVVEHKIWTPSSYKVEKALKVSISGTALFKSFSEYKERFTDTEATLVLTDGKGELYYVAEQEGLTYVAVKKYPIWEPWKYLAQMSIVGKMLRLEYARNIGAWIVLGITIPMVIMAICIFLGASLFRHGRIFTE